MMIRPHEISRVGGSMQRLPSIIEAEPLFISNKESMRILTGFDVSGALNVNLAALVWAGMQNRMSATVVLSKMNTFVLLKKYCFIKYLIITLYAEWKKKKQISLL